MSLNINISEDFTNLWTNDFESSHIDSYTYNDFRYSLLVKFSDGSRYLYTGVPPSVYWKLEMSTSKGKFITNSLRRHYACTKVDNAQ